MSVDEDIIKIDESSILKLPVSELDIEDQDC